MKSKSKWPNAPQRLVFPRSPRDIETGGVHVHDLHTIMMHLLGIDHKYQGRHFRLTDVHGQVVKEVLA